MEDYIEFLKRKKKKINDVGFDISLSEINPLLFDYQKFCVQMAVKKGRFALFGDTGTGKTLMQCEWARIISDHTNKPVLILAPLAVSGQTIEESAKFNIEVKSYNHQSEKGIYISNYEQIENIDISIFSGIVLDESSILKNYTGKYRYLIIAKFKDTPYKLPCTATPSPNDLMELGNHSEFLNVMGRNEMLAMYFVHDGGNTSKWRVKKHAKIDFFRFVNTWSIMFTKPSDIGFDDKNHILPELNIHEIEIKTKSRNNYQLFNDVAVSATNFNQELRYTKEDRLKKTIEIVNNSNEPFIIWIKHDEEGLFLRKHIKDAVEVSGKDKNDVKVKNLLGFAKGAFRVLITKTKIAQYGLNYQHCRNQIFPSLDFSFESLYQAIRRSYRYGQKQNVNIYIVKTDTMINVSAAIKEKQRTFDELRENIVKLLKSA